MRHIDDTRNSHQRYFCWVIGRSAHRGAPLARVDVLGRSNGQTVRFRVTAADSEKVYGRCTMSTNGHNPDFGLRQAPDGRLEFVDSQGHVHQDVEPVRDFPMSDPDRWISVCDADGRELMVIDDLTTLSPELRHAVERNLSRREFVPTIRRILSVPADTEPAEWDVETDRGRTQFLVNSGDDVRRLYGHRALIIDSQGIRYVIDDMRRLDPASKRILDLYLHYL